MFTNFSRMFTYFINAHAFQQFSYNFHLFLQISPVLTQFFHIFAYVFFWGLVVITSVFLPNFHLFSPITHLFPSFQTNFHIHLFSQIFTYFHLFSQIFTYFHLFSPIFTYFHLFSPIFTYFHLFSPIFTYFHLFSRIC